MQINIDVTKEFLDTVSFVLVTPEFLGEHTLASIRNFLNNTAPYLYRISGYVAAISFIPAVLIIDSWDIAIFAGTSEWYWSVKLLVLAIISGLVLSCMILLVYFIVSQTARLVVRRVMFGVGALLFFSSRAISMWHAWGEHTPAPTETPQHTGAPAARLVSGMDIHSHAMQLGSTWTIIPIADWCAPPQPWPCAEPPPFDRLPEKAPR